MADLWIFAKRFTGGISRAFAAAGPILTTATGIAANVCLATIIGLLLVVLFVALVVDINSVLGPTETTYSNALILGLSLPLGVWVWALMAKRFKERILKIRKGGSRIRALLPALRRDSTSRSVG
jgi:hypothetical protein